MAKMVAGGLAEKNVTDKVSARNSTPQCACAGEIVLLL